MSSLMERMLKTSTVKESDTLEDSTFLNNKSEIVTDIPAMNIMSSGEIWGGFSCGLSIFAGPSKHFKTLFGLCRASAYMKEHPDSIMLFYDSEFGAAKEYFETFDIDPNRVIHTPVMNVEQLKFDLATQLEKGVERGDKVFIFVDSIGNLASKKEVEDALDQKSVADMSRAKAIKSLFRISTPYLTTKDVHMCVIAHTYDTMEMFSKKVVSGGTGLIYSANEIFIVGKRKVKDGKELAGHEFVLNVEKSRTVKEGSAVPITVLFNGGIDRWSGLLDIALHTGHVTKPKNGWFTRPSVEDDKNWRRAATSSEEFWMPLLDNDEFLNAVRSLYKLSASKLSITVDDFEVDPETGEVLDHDDEG